MKQKIKVLILFSFLLGLNGVKAQSIITINSIKYGCVDRVDTIINGHVIYNITKTSSGILFFDKVIPPAGDTLYKYDVYKNDTLPSSLLYTETRSFSSDSLALSYKINASLPNGEYFIKLYFKTRNSSFSSRLCLYEIQTATCTTTGCQTIANPNFATTLANPGFSPFDAGGVPCWMCAWGSPQITANANPNLHYAMMWHGAANSPTSPQAGEGITQYLVSPLSTSKIYALVAEAKQYPGTSIAVDNFIVSLTHTATSNVPPASATAYIPSFSAQQILNSNQINNTSSWKTLGGCFTPNQNYDQVVVYPKQNAGHNVPGWVAIKSVGIYDLTPKHTILTVNCHDNVTLGSAACVIPNAQYAWSPSTGLSNPNIINPTVSPITNITYTLTVTIPYSGGPSCSFQDTYHINVLPTTKPTISGAQAICPAVSTTLTASGAATYTWQPTNSTGATQILSPTVTTTYTVYSTTAQGCLSSNTVVVTVFNVPSLTLTASPNVTTCPGANTAVFATGGGSGYTWYPGGTVASSIVATPTAPVIYTVTSVTSDGCPQRGTILINPISCCTLTNTPLFTATSGTITGGTYVLNSPLTLTNHLVLQGVTIFMGTNAEILVPNGLVLGMFTTHLLGCPQMWKGIRCTGTAASIIAVKNTMIEDAITAIDLANVSTPVYQGNILFLENMTFNKNYTAVNIENYNASNGHFPMFMGDALFTSRKLITPDHLLVNPALTVNYNWPTATNINTLKGFPTIPTIFNPDADLLTTYRFSVANFASSNCEVPYLNTVGQQGVRLKNVNASGNYNGFLMNAYNTLYDNTTFNFHNLFDNLHFGINATNSNVYVSNAIYQYMSQYVSGTEPNAPGFKTYAGGVGLYSENTLSSGSPGAQAFSLTAMPYQGKDYNKSGNFFFNNAYGIKTSNIQYVKASLNVFHSSRINNAVGPFQANAPVGSGQYAMYMKSNDYRDIQILNNFTANVNNGMIFMADAHRLFSVFYTTNAGSVTVQSNNFKANYGNTATNQSMAQAIAIDNIVSPNVVNLVTGNTANIVVSNNNISRAYNGIEASNWNNQRIIVSTNTVSLMDNGSVNTSQYGIQHSNNTGDHIFNNMISGFNLSKVKVIGISAAENKSQSVWCNTTEKSYYGIVFRGSQNLTSWRNNTMQAHKRGMLLDNTTIGQQGAIGQPIANLWAGTWLGEYKLYVNGMDPGSPSGNSKLYLNSLPAASESDANFFVLRYKTTIPQSLFLTGGFSTVACPYTKLTANPLALQAHKANLHNIVADSFAYGANVNANRKNGRLAVYRAMIQDSTLAGSDSLLNAFKNAADASNIGQLFRIENAFYEGGLIAAEAMLNSLSPVDTVEATQKKVYQLYLRSKQNTFSVSDRNALTDLASACPAKMGVGVYQARAIINSLYDVFYHFENDCGDVGQPGQRRGREENEPELPATGFLLYPNPGTGTLYVSTEGMGVDSYRVTVYDIAGKAIFIKDNQEGGKVNMLDLNLSNGVYLMQLTDQANGDVYKQKFIIQK